MKQLTRATPKFQIGDKISLNDTIKSTITYMPACELVFPKGTIGTIKELGYQPGLGEDCMYWVEFEQSTIAVFESEFVKLTPIGKLLYS